MKALSIWNCARETRAAPASGGEGSHPRKAVASTMTLSALSRTGASLHWGFRVHQHGITGIATGKEEQESELRGGYHPVLRCRKNFVPLCFKLLELPGAALRSRSSYGLFEREKRVATIPAHGGRQPAMQREFCRAGAGGKCNAMRVAQHTDHVHALGHVEFTSIWPVV